MSSLFPLPAFDPDRAIIFDHAWFPTLQVTTTRPLTEALAAGQVDAAARVLVMTLPSATLVFDLVHIVYHHLAEGEHDGQPWVASFCSICNNGAVFDPRVKGVRHHFEPRGLYQAMVLMGDTETRSLWDHLNGACVHGAHQGQQLNHLTNLLHKQAGQAALAFPDALWVVHTLDPALYAEATEDVAWSAEPTPEWSPRMEGLLAREDERLPRLTIGLGMQTKNIRRYYPMSVLNAHDNFLFDTLDGRPVLVYVGPETGIPEVIFCEAQSGYWLGDILRLSTGATLKGGIKYGRDGERLPIERPAQLFSRWYSFALQAPNCEIYGR